MPPASVSPPEQKKKRKAVLALMLGATLAVGAGAAYETYLRLDSSANCEPDHLGAFALHLSMGRGDGAPETLMTREELRALHVRFEDGNPNKLTCSGTGGIYEWGFKSPGMLARGFAVWDGRPHGWLLKFRNALLVDGTLIQISESEFRSLLPPSDSGEETSR